MSSPFQTIREDIHQIIDHYGGIEQVTDTSVRLKNKNNSFGTIARVLKQVYGTTFYEAHEEWIWAEMIAVLNSLPSTMLMQFTNFLDSRLDPFDFETCHWESKYGEVFILSKNMKEEIARHSEWILCLSQKKNRGIAMFRKTDNGEMSFVFFTDPTLFIETYFPVLVEHPQAFDEKMHGEDLLVIPRICRC
uniref:Uncharacterized protein n=1 Tax=Pithovirus LCPAC304 TaxID=2506594 RepID=A0A481Z9H7_9VIRU|nr:MAG: hypothetical protein LCPAC304_03790 [Pithovirus LCPAC304]